MFTPSIEDMARVLLRNRGAEGMFAMLEFYLDDSGTHDAAPVAVWGGVIGYKTFLDQLDAAWREQLKHPCDGKPAIRAFHSSHLANSWGEFESYSDAERDLTRRNFRKIVIDSGVTILSFGVSVKDWDQIVRQIGGQPENTANQAAFGQAVKAGLEAATNQGQPINFLFDAGCDKPEIREAIAPAIKVIGSGGNFVSYGFAPVAQFPALQAADLVAHESYRVFKSYLETGAANPNPHTARLFAEAHDSQAAWMGRRQMKSLMTKINRKRRREKR